ncbi:MAG: hypothetical protein CL878_04425 [Dehalococcoidia bacterium]|nr:hypothetical protein [Dehalococcoidia bacterium]
MPDYRLLALDIDGTLLNSERVVTPRTRAAVLSARAAGLVVVIATGRGPHSARSIVAGLGLGDPIVLVATQGATVWDNGQLVLHQPLAADAARRVVEHSLAADVAALVVPGVHSGGAMHLAGSAAATGRLRAYAQRGAGNVRPYDPAALSGDPLAVYMMDDWQRLVAVNERLTSDPVAQDSWRVIFSRTALATTAAIEVLHPQVSKALALRVLCRRLGIEREQVLAFGDNVNDVEMLEFAGLGVAMANSSPEARAAADRITASNDEDGIALVLEEMELAPRRDR